MPLHSLWPRRAARVYRLRTHASRRFTCKGHTERATGFAAIIAPDIPGVIVLPRSRSASLRRLVAGFTAFSTAVSTSAGLWLVPLPAAAQSSGAGGAKKGDVLGVARVAAIQAAKRTAELIPLCHPLSLTRVEASFELQDDPACVWCTVTVEAWERTGVEMEALTAVQIGLLTIYDMCKAVERGMTIQGVRLLEKRGGKSGDYVAEPTRG